MMENDPRRISGMPSADPLTGTEYAEIIQKDQEGQWINKKLLVTELEGPEGARGKNAYEIAVSKGYDGTISEWLASLQGRDGTPGGEGPAGPEGLSAYEIAREEGYNGNVGEWLTTLQGEDGRDGESAYQIAVRVNGFDGGEAAWLASLQGTDGAEGPRGDDGLSAYEIAVNEGFDGSQSEWVESLKGLRGPEGFSAYQLALNAGFQGSVEQWLETLKGQDGIIGRDGLSTYELALESGYVGSLEEWLSTAQGPQGADGPRGRDGPTGKSAFEHAQDEGFQGSLTEWLATLKGADGRDGDPGPEGKSAFDLALETGFVGSLEEWLETAQGPQGVEGPRGADGSPGTPGQSAYELAVDRGFSGDEDAWLTSLEGTVDLTVSDNDNTFTNAKRLKFEGATVRREGNDTIIHVAGGGGGLTEISLRKVELSNNNQPCYVNIMAYGSAEELSEISVTVEENGSFIRFDNIPETCRLKNVSVAYFPGFNGGSWFGIRYPEPFGDTSGINMHIPHFFCYNHALPMVIQPLTNIGVETIANGFLQLSRSGLVSGEGYHWSFVIL